MSHAGVATEAQPGHEPAPDVASVRVRRLVARDFRNLERVDLDLPPGGLVLVGRNGQGKTNLIEAIHYAHALRSMRGARDQDLIRFGAQVFHIAVTVEGARVDELRVGMERGGTRKRLVLDGAEVPRLTDALGAVPSIVLSPRDVVLVSGAPQERRRFLDIVLASTSPRYLSALQKYRAALARRNAVLHSAGARSDAPSLAAVWEPALAMAGACLWKERVAWVQEAAPRVHELCARIGESGSITLRYHTTAGERLSAASTESELRLELQRVLARDRASDIRRGLTQHGPHRDDLVISLNGRLARAFGSAGQQRTIALALRLVEGETLRTRLARDPVLLLDDPFAELDQERARGVRSLLEGHGSGQRVLAVPRGDDVPVSFHGLARYRIEGGVVTHD